MKPLRQRTRRAADFEKMAIGYLGVGLAFVFAAGVATLGVVPVILCIVSYLITDLAIGWSEPAVQSLISRDAPQSVNAMMMAVMKATTMVSYFIVGWTGRFFEPPGAPLIWVTTGAQSLLALVMIVAGISWLRRLLEAEQAVDIATVGA